ncbi:MAG: family 10 glycosylhydrolase, partial [Clostridia bacterium]|nr:family 10 glycosylhydrolase [Clostridia bacterium]
DFMKRAIALLLCLLLFLCSCRAQDEQNGETAAEQSGEIHGVWISYNEVDAMLSRGFKEDFKTVISNCKTLKITDIFLHTVPFGNTLYKSEIYPQNEKASALDFDVLKYAVSECHKNRMRLHAWINPYRVSTALHDVDSLPQNSAAYIWTHDDIKDNDKNVCICDGIYLNPAESDVRALIIDVVREITLNYGVDGIHFDDYFYPTTDETFDKESYNAYLTESEIPISLADFRRSCVNGLISGVYTAVKFIDKDIMFSVSPAASLKRDYEDYYADVSCWCKSGCVDFIVPQLYFGFNYKLPEFCFENLLKVWKNAVKDTDTKLVIGLATYKIGTDSENDKEEFANVDTIPRQVELCKTDENISGYSFFSYGSLFSDKELNTKAREKIRLLS